MTTTNRRIAVTLSILAAGTAFALPAGAQFAGGRSAFDQRARPELVQFNDFFRPFWGNEPQYRNRGYDPYNPFTQQRPQQSYEPIKPPAPTAKKPDAPAPTETVLVIGDQLADWLGYGLEEALADTPQIGIARRIKPYSGLVRYEQRADSPDWSQAVKEMLATEKPSAIVVMLGSNDRLPLRERIVPKAPPATEGAAAAEHHQAAAAGADAAHKQTPPPPPPQPVLGPSYEFHTDKWGELYAKRIDEMIAALKTKGVPILWVGLPSIRGAKSTSDMSYLDELYRARADKAGIGYVDIWDGFVDDQGRYTQQGPDFEGQTRRLRTYDGVNFTKYGAEKLAHYVEHELRRVLNSHVVPVALPGPEEQAPAKGPTDTAKPVVGPVVPLNTLTSEGGELLGSGKTGAAKKEPDAIAARVLSRGEALAAPHGRSDDFSWPRADISSEPAPDAASPPAASPAPSQGGGKADKSDAGKSEPKKPAAAAPNAAPNGAATGAPAAAPNAAPARPRQTTLDGGPAPRPPLPLGPNAAR